MGEIADIVTRFVQGRTPLAMEAVGIVLAAAVSNEIDTPYPPASAPGTPPHNRTGQLHAGVAHEERREGNDFVVEITSSRVPQDISGDSIHEQFRSVAQQQMIPVYLEFGTRTMAARPYMRPVMNQVKDTAPATLRKSFSPEETYAASA